MPYKRRTSMTGASCNPREIVACGIKKSFDTLTVLRGVDLQVARGETVAVVGGSGCGKTVLMNLILGLLTPDAGTILVADHTTRGAPMRDTATLPTGALERLHGHWGVVFQRNALFSGSVLDNIALWLRETRNMDEKPIRDVAQRVLAAVGLPTTESFLAQGAERLSGGMAKRLAVARALAMAPVLMFYDEPTTGLDPENAAQIHELIRATQSASVPDGPRTALIITHDKDLLARLQPRVLMLHEGTVLFDGRYDDFRQSSHPSIRPYFELMPQLQLRSIA